MTMLFHRLAGVVRSRAFLAINGALLVALAGLAVARYAPLAQAWLAARQSPAARVMITGPGAGATTITAYVLGDVQSPGVYTLAQDARVQDLVAASGGALPDADLARVDLAAHVVDGQEVYVPRVGEVVPVTLGGKVDINVASVDDLRNALGLSKENATRIVTYRVSHGGFTAVSQLLLVPISRTTYDRIKDLVTV